MYEIDTSRLDLVEEFHKNPTGPHSSELTLLVNRLRVMPIPDRHILICTQRGTEWRLAKIPNKRGEKIKFADDQIFTNYNDAIWEVFKRRWHTVTKHQLNI